jgi:hypothetical protein
LNRKQFSQNNIYFCFCWSDWRDLSYGECSCLNSWSTGEIQPIFRNRSVLPSVSEFDLTWASLPSFVHLFHFEFKSAKLSEFQSNFTSSNLKLKIFEYCPTSIQLPSLQSKSPLEHWACYSHFLRVSSHSNDSVSRRLISRPHNIEEINNMTTSIWVVRGINRNFCKQRSKLEISRFRHQRPSAFINKRRPLEKWIALDECPQLFLGHLRHL